MRYKVKTTPDFDKEYKAIVKKYRSIKKDISKLINDLEVAPTKGVHLGKNLYKIRIPISGTNKGKSGGARVITCVVVVDEVVYLSEIYLKSDYDTVDSDLVIRRLKDSGLI